MQQTPNPYQPPAATPYTVPVWRRLTRAVLLVAAFAASILATLMATAGIRWLMLEERLGPQYMPPLAGISLHAYQALLIGAAISATAGVVAYVSAQRFHK